MIATFINKYEAVKLSDSIHTFLQKNCKGYNAIRWQIPIENEDGSFSIKLPREYDTSLYKTISLKEVKNELIKYVAVDIKIASLTLLPLARKEILEIAIEPIIKTTK